MDPRPHVTDRLLTPQDIADRCQISAKTVLRAIRAGRLRACRLGTRGGFRIHPADAETWIASCMVEPRPAAPPPAPLADAVPAPIPGALKLTPGMGRTSAARYPGS